jgi:hypothetical protein
LILDAFSRVLRHPDNATASPAQLLVEWITAILTDQPMTSLDSLSDNDLTPAQIKAIFSQAFQLIQTNHGPPAIVSRHTHAQQLLDSLLHYAHSFDDWQYRRWLHTTKATDFYQA